MIKHGDKMTEVLDSLNENQYKAATTIDSHVRIIAGAGSGKTRVLMARIVYLVNTIGVYPSRILAITFTNKATNEMKERLIHLLGEDAYSVRISTIHALCVRILREDADKLGYPKSFTILDSDDQRSILNPFYRELDIDKKSFPLNKVIGFISSHKMAHVDPDEAENYVQTEDQEIMVKLYRKYEKKKKEMKAFDFDDLLLEGHHLLNFDREVREKWQNRLDYIHVDEFQDVDPTQYGIIRLLTGPDTKLCVVGDPDQTIYTWRGASVDIILRFDKDFPDCKTLILNQNYRSTQPILNASNAVIAHNQSRIKKDLFTQLPGNEKIHVHCESDDDQEPLYVARLVKQRHDQGVPYANMAVLYRSNYTSRAFEKRMRQAGIPYVVYGGIRFYERQEIKDALSYLKLCTRPDLEDPQQFSLDLAVTRVINQPRRKIGAVSLQKIQDEASRRHINMLETMRHSEDLTGATKKRCEDFVHLIDDLRSHREDYALEDFLDYVLDRSGYMNMLEQEEDTARIDNLKELKQDIAQTVQENPDTTLETYLQDISLFTDRNEVANSDHILLMTVHAAKGLEFDTVFLVNFNDGIFPSLRSMDEGGNAALEEERRLCYVAMTRAKKALYITYNRGYSYMLEGNKLPSRFLKEIPDTFIESDAIQTRNQPQKPILSSRPKAGHHSKYRKGDLVEHTVYGQGVIIKIEGRVATIAFDHKIGVKKLNILHPSLKKVVS